jgi:hypothetical protein
MAIQLRIADFGLQIIALNDLASNFPDSAIPNPKSAIGTGLTL